jgi:hypothetical protein
MSKRWFIYLFKEAGITLLSTSHTHDTRRGPNAASRSRHPSCRASHLHSRLRTGTSSCAAPVPADDAVGGRPEATQADTTWPAESWRLACWAGIIFTPHHYFPWKTEANASDVRERRAEPPRLEKATQRKYRRRRRVRTWRRDAPSLEVKSRSLRKWPVRRGSWRADGAIGADAGILIVFVSGLSGKRSTLWVKTLILHR